MPQEIYQLIKEHFVKISVKFVYVRWKALKMIKEFNDHRITGWGFGAKYIHKPSAKKPQLKFDTRLRGTVTESLTNWSDVRYFENLVTSRKLSGIAKSLAQIDSTLLTLFSYLPKRRSSLWISTIIALAWLHQSNSFQRSLGKPLA